MLTSLVPMTPVEFLGFQLSKDGWAPTESKVVVIVEWPAPETVKHLRSFLGMEKFSYIHTSILRHVIPTEETDHDGAWLTEKAACELPMGFGQPGQRTGFTGHAMRVVEAW